MKLSNEQLMIRSTSVNDVDILCKWWADGQIMAHAGFPNGIKTNKEKLKLKIENQDQNSHSMMIVYDDISIGEMSYRIENDTAEIGIKICNFEFQNKGLGKKCLSMLINYLFYDLKIEKIILDTNLNNKRAQYVYETLGFKKVNINIDVWKDQMGTNQSSVDYELKMEDWLSK